MPRIFDNLASDTSLLPALRETLDLSSRADFCVGYFNLRGWGGLAPLVDRWQPGDGPCRVLIGMQRLPHDDLRDALSLIERPSGIDNQTAHRLKVQLAEQLRQQLTIGAPTNADERTLRQLASQLRAKKVVVKLFLRHPLHAKLYLLFRNDPINPIVGFLGSSNLTFAGLSAQGELNVDVLDQDATVKLKQWFEDRWDDRFCVDITDELLQIIEESWAREALIPPYHVYLKMAYHLSHEARAGLAEFRGFPVPESMFSDARLRELGRLYLKDIDRNSTMLVRQQKQTGKTETQSFKIQKSKPIIDKIDRVLAEHYGFTEEELDFIINYDIKYRMGRNA